MAKKAPEPEKENSERWLLTYADMITLLLALFIVLYAISQVDAGKYNAIADAMGDAMGDGSTKRVVVVSTASGESEIAIPGDPTAEMFKELLKKLEEEVKAKGYGDSIDIDHDDNSITLRFKDTVLFEPDRAVMLPQSTQVLSNMVEIIRKLQSSIGHIEISGHTANIGTTGENAYRLGFDRAMAVFRVLTRGGFSEAKVSAKSYSHYQPIASNSTNDGRSRNRRVELRITKSEVDGKQTSKTSKTSQSASE